VAGDCAETSGWPGNDGPRIRPRNPCCPVTIAYASTPGVVILAGPEEIIGVIPPDVPGRVPPEMPLVGAVVGP